MGCITSLIYHFSCKDIRHLLHIVIYITEGWLMKNRYKSYIVNISPYRLIEFVLLFAYEYAYCHMPSSIVDVVSVWAL